VAVSKAAIQSQTNDFFVREDILCRVVGFFSTNYAAKVSRNFSTGKGGGGSLHDVCKKATEGRSCDSGH
jgi:hypothetical protein